MLCVAQYCRCLPERRRTNAQEEAILRTYRPWMGGTGISARWRHFVSKMHRNCMLLLRKVCVTLGCPTIKGSEGGGAKRLLAVKGLWPPHVPPGRKEPGNQSSNRKPSGQGRGFHSSPMLAAARECMAVNSGSDSTCATLPEVGSTSESSSPEDSSPPSNATIDIWSSTGAPNEMLGPP